MQILSALDAISPAFSRTKLVLFSPFRVGRTWKLALTAYLSAASSAFLPTMFILLAFLPEARMLGGLGLVAAVIVGVFFFTILFALLFYVFTRLRFASFDITLNHGVYVAPAWRKYGSQSLKWTLFKILLGSVVTALLAGPTILIVRQFIRLFQSMPSMNFSSDGPPPPEVVQAIITVYLGFAAVYILFGLFFFLSSLMADFIVPSLALENTTLGEAFRRLGKIIRNEPGQFTAYAFLKLGLGLVAYFGGTLITEIVLFIVALIIAAIAGVVGFLLHLAGVPNDVLIVLAVIIGVAFYLFFIFYAVFIVVGTVMTFLESYTLYFLGGRYPMLGDLLTASTPPRPPPPPAPFYPAYAPPPPPPQVL
jgi:hypothetical protein